MTSDTPRRIASDHYYEFFEIGLEVNDSFDHRLLHTVARIASSGAASVALTRTDTGYISGDDDGNGYKPSVETQRFYLSEQEMLMLIEAFQTVRAERAERDAQIDPDEIPF